MANASDQKFALIDSRATNAWRPAREGELGGSRVIRTDLHSQSACQVIIPAGYLVQLGYSITWRKKGCLIKRGRSEVLSVDVAKGCPLIPKQKGLEILDEYEARLEKGEVYMLKPTSIRKEGLTQSTAREWLATRVAEGRLTREDQLAWLQTMFPEVPLSYLNKAAGLDVNPFEIELEGAPWNRRRRRSILRARKGEVLVHRFSGQHRWKCKGVVVEVEKSKGADLMSVGVWQHLLAWAIMSKVGGVVGGPPCRSVSCCRTTQDDGGPPPLRGRQHGTV